MIYNENNILGVKFRCNMGDSTIFEISCIEDKRVSLIGYRGDSPADDSYKKLYKVVDVIKYLNDKTWIAISESIETYNIF